MEEGKDKSNSTNSKENHNEAETAVMEDFDKVESKPQDAPPEKQESEPQKNNEKSPEKQEQEPEKPKADPKVDDDDIEDITPEEPSKKSKPPSKKKFEEDKIPDKTSQKAPFPPLSESLDPEYWDLSDSSEDEGMPDYKIGGYHPVHVGEVFSDRYIIIQKLGWGHFSTVWLSKDTKYNTYVAMKIQKSSQNYLEAAYDEVEILDQCSTNWHKKEWQTSCKEYYQEYKGKLMKRMQGPEGCACVQLLNSFLHYGPNGKHFVMVFEILGVNLLEVIKKYEYKGVPIPVTRQIAKQCLIGLDYLHRMCNIIHTDLKPENVLVAL